MMTDFPTSLGRPPQALLPRGGAERSIILELADLFVIRPVHRPEDTRVFQELMMSLYMASPAAERKLAAQLLSPRIDLPSDVAALIAADDIEIARPLLLQSQSLATLDRIRIIGNRSEAHRAALASRCDLEDAVISALLLHGGSETIAALSANPQLTLSPAQIDRLVDRVIEEGRPLEALSARLELGAARRIDLFFELSQTDRRSTLIAFDRETAFQRIEKRGRRTPPAVRPGLQRRLIDAVFAGDTETYAELLAESLGIHAKLSHRIIADPHGEPLVVALIAAGVDATDATSILVRSDPALGWTYHTIRDLVRVHEAIGWRTAEAIIARWSAVGGERLTAVLRQSDGSQRQVVGERRVVRGEDRQDPAQDQSRLPRR